MKKRLLFSLLACIMFVDASAYDFEVDGLCYDIVSIPDRTVEVASCRQPYNYVNYHFSSVTIPSAVTFQGITWDVIGIGYSAFFESPLQSITIPSSIQYIGELCFGNTPLKTINGLHRNLLLWDMVFSGASIESVDISMCRFSDGRQDRNPSEYEDILVQYGIEPLNQGDDLFAVCSNLTQVKLPEDVKVLGSGMFFQCRNLQSITIPLSTKAILCQVFNLCTSLKELNLYNVELMCENAISGCTNLQRVYLGNIKKVLGSVFSECPSLKDIIMFGTDPVDIPEETFTNGHYVYATLWVPKGTAEKYRACTGWKNFLNIKEGTPDDAKFAISVETSEDGNTSFVSSSNMATQHLDYVDKGGNRDIIIMPNEGKEIESVTINGEDVTSTLVEASANSRPTQSTGVNTTSSLILPIKNVDGLKTVEISYKDKGMSGISEVGLGSKIPNGTIYCLDGRSVTTPQKGIYIRNGKKYILK